ncbi:chloramphenicol phosphotransferase CPT family protein [Hyphomonas oceanitis]|uniref:chloramphenicol phosphotransferase CPT family protein n=1 Tax=Hyphomonas oceanitis TaxID=81033 RepID=UPI00300251EB
MRSKVVILNGTSSAGKTTLARALQAVAEQPFLHVQMDTFLEMMPLRYAHHPEGLRILPLEGINPPEVMIKTGPYATRVLRGMRHAIAAMANEGLNLIVDDVMLDKEQDEYQALLASHDVTFVKVYATLEASERREVARGDREIGQVRWQYGRVHAHVRYDLEVDTTASTPETCARFLADALNL